MLFIVKTTASWDILKRRPGEDYALRSLKEAKGFLSWTSEKKYFKQVVEHEPKYRCLKMLGLSEQLRHLERPKLTWNSLLSKRSEQLSRLSAISIIPYSWNAFEHPHSNSHWSTDISNKNAPFISVLKLPFFKSPNEQLHILKNSVNSELPHYIAL